ncbi:MucBP domain-containing protein [Enterococcus rivorum]|uniref:Gram-positive cocci surface proteins LPxTG domain-containing protein n=2 Tax=Enterococcus rivorum TaxID=762845 RepID=A0A1E5KVW9_9ENTE|nr:MucBP domain-containing protein [Enterococcus rivorum]MBP2100278.1 LPXTG-motif cell wall-anchored protein [Enterococcus rivorum]OEH82001.1 hypothetical protein BCR26_14920 [Enterococcus rivorum]
MKKTNHILDKSKKVVYSLSIITLLAPTLLSSSLALAEETTSETEQSVSQEALSMTEDSTTETVDSSESDIPSESTDNETSTTSESTISTTEEEPVIAAEPKQVATQTNQEVVTFGDPILKQAITSALGLPAGSDLTKADMEKLTYLPLYDASTAQLSSLSGLEYAINLTSINMGTNNVSDLSVLEKLPALGYLYLQAKNVTSANFPDLSNSPNIKTISLSGSSVDNDVLPKLAAAQSVDYINLDSIMAITTIEPLKNLPNLKTLFIQFCGVTDFTVINEFPVLNNLAAFGQNTGRLDASTTINRSKLQFDAEKQTLFLPFSMMPNRMTNFDGYVPPFSTSNSQSNTYFDLNGTQLSSDRLSISEEGITVLNMTEEEFNQINSFKYNARLNNAAGTYAQPDGYVFYAISSGTYLHSFEVSDKPEVGASVVVNFKDVDGKEIMPSEALVGGVLGSSFEVTPKEIGGYTLKETIGSPTGVFTTETQEITFIYEKEKYSEDIGTVSVHFETKEGKKIKDSTVLSGIVGDTYQVEKNPAISGYTLKDIKGELDGIYKKNPQDVTFIYEKNDESTGSSTQPESSETNSSSENKAKKITDSTTSSSSMGSFPNGQSSQASTDEPNSKKLPNTGEQVNSIYLLIGGILVAIGAFVYWLRKKK